MVDKVNSEKNYYKIAMFINAAFFMLMHLTFVQFNADDAYFIIHRNNFNSLTDVIVDRYLTDSSRVLSESVLFFLIDKPFIIWQILDTLMCILLFHALSIILINDKHSKANIILFMGIACYPFMHTGQAGWICTSLNFLWPLAALSYGFSCSARRYRGKEVRPFTYVLAISAFIFAANCEQSSAVIAMISVIMLIYAFIDKRSKGFEIISLLIGIGGIVWALSAPGNGERVVMEAANWMPEFMDLTFIDKFRLCAVYVFEHFVMIPDVIFFLFALTLALSGISRKNKWWQNIIAIIPIVVDLVFTAPYVFRDFVINHKTNYEFTNPAIYIQDSHTAFIQYSELLGLFIFIVASILTICFAMKNIREKVISIGVLAAGFAVRMALMLTPTMFASGHRTLIYMYFAFIYVAIMLIKQKYYDSAIYARWQKVLINIVLILGIIVNLILTVGRQLRIGKF